MKWISIAFALAASGWLGNAALRFLGPSFPGRGLWVAVPIDGHFEYQNGVLRVISGEARALDFGPWWLASILASIALLLVLALRGCFVRGPSRATSDGRPLE